MLMPEEVAAWARGLGVTDVVTAWSPVGWTATMLGQLELDGIRLHRLRRGWDSACWPLARAGFFGVSKQIPAVLERFGMAETRQSALRF